MVICSKLGLHDHIGAGHHWSSAPAAAPVHPRREATMASNSPGLIGLDWGTTALRAYLLGNDGRVLDSVTTEAGMMHIPDGRFDTAFRSAVGGWQTRWPALKTIASGMVGSRQGWVEAPYLPCPVGPDDLAKDLTPVPGGGLVIVPGAAHFGSLPNVMRGEETQIAGWLALHPGRTARARLVLPGTHSKWVEIEDGRIERFATYMTGELFAVLRSHSILGRLAPAAGPPEDEARAAFARGVEEVRCGGHVAPLLFSARSLVLTGGLKAELSLEYLSGLLIGEELACALPTGGTELALIGDPALCQRYVQALALFGLREVSVMADAEANAAGLWSIARCAGLVTEAAEVRA
jgi:2-dehydro-3-deoxygalactonokinase